MHEAQRKRLAKLETEIGLCRQAVSEVVRILPFIEGEEEAQAVRCEGPFGFVSYRREGESFYDFDARASNEVLAARPPLCSWPTPVLVFLPDLEKPVKSVAAA